MGKERERDRYRERIRDVREADRALRDRDRGGRDRRRPSPAGAERRNESRRDFRERSRSHDARRRSRSPRKERKRSSDRKYRPRRSRSSGRRAKHSKGESDDKDIKEEGEEEQKVDFTADITPEDVQMMQAMGIPFGFDSSKGKDIKDASTKLSSVRTKSLRQARQYMNRKGGFNRPLPSERTNEKVIRD